MALDSLSIASSSPDSAPTVNIPNPLHAYPSYTYSLSLHLLTTKQWNDVQETGHYTATNVLIASAGRWDKFSFIRNPNFSEDFFIESLKMNTVVMPTQGNPGTNAITVNFNIIEPIGVTLLDRLIAANKELPEPQSNYLETTYLLQIDFYGSNDAGEIVHPIENLTKYIPIRITTMDISVTSHGSEYAVQAVPYGHSAHNQSTQQTPANFEITADNIKSFFAASTATPTASGQQSQRDQPDTTMQSTNASTTESNSYANALNKWQLQLVADKNQAEPDEYDFVFDDEIGQAKLVEDGKLPPRNTIMATQAQAGAIAKADVVLAQGANNTAADISFQVKTYSINSGTTIESVLANTIKNSTYILNQIVNPSDYNGKVEDYIRQRQAISKKPFKWFKICPKVTVTKYDPVRKAYARKIVYYVKTFTITNLKIDFAPGKVADTPLKVYEYIYTGHNRDILSLDLKFNSAVYTKLTSNPNKTLLRTGAADQTGSSQNSELPNSDTLPSDEMAPVKVITTVGDQQNVATGGILTGAAVTAADVSKSVLTDSGGDMASVELKIVGDPLFIKQDDVFYPPTVATAGSPAPMGVLTDNNSIKTDNGQIHAQLTINTPMDRDETTGLMKYDPKFPKSSFSGMYMVIQIDSDFEKGLFTQVLHMVRLPKQPTTDYINGGNNVADSSSAQRNSDLGLTSIAKAADILAVSATNSVNGLISSVTGVATDIIPPLAQLTKPVTETANALQNNLTNISKTAQTVPIGNQGFPSIINTVL